MMSIKRTPCSRSSTCVLEYRMMTRSRWKSMSKEEQVAYSKTLHTASCLLSNLTVRKALQHQFVRGFLSVIINVVFEAIILPSYITAFLDAFTPWAIIGGRTHLRDPSIIIPQRQTFDIKACQCVAQVWTTFL